MAKLASSASPDSLASSSQNTSISPQGQGEYNKHWQFKTSWCIEEAYLDCYVVAERDVAPPGGDQAKHYDDSIESNEMKRIQSVYRMR